jgi:hypothetical protein
MNRWYFGRRGLTRRDPTKKQYMELLDKLAGVGLVEWVAGPSGVKHQWRFTEEPVDDGSADQRIQALKDLDPDEQRLFAVIVNAVALPQSPETNAG